MKTSFPHTTNHTFLPLTSGGDIKLNFQGESESFLKIND